MPIVAACPADLTRANAHFLDHAGASAYHQYDFDVSKTSVDVDRDIASEAADIRRLELIVLLQDRERYDLDAACDAWGGDD